MNYKHMKYLHYKNLTFLKTEKLRKKLDVKFAVSVKTTWKNALTFWVIKCTFCIPFILIEILFYFFEASVKILPLHMKKSLVM